MLLEFGGEDVINAQGYNGETLLSHCSGLGFSPECCEMLLRAGAVASLSIRAFDGETPLDIASRRQNSCQEVLLRFANAG
jgi:ankyrin repeat protein